MHDATRHNACLINSVPVPISPFWSHAMSKFDLRDISQRLTASRDVEAVVFEFLGYLQTVRPDWSASLSFYEISRDALVNVCTRQGNRLVRRDLVIQVDQLPPRLVRKFFHPSAFFNTPDRRTSLLTHLFQTSPSYEPDPSEAGALQPLSPTPSWGSCLCMPLADREDLIALLVITSDKRGAFPSKVVGEIIPLKSLAAMALAQQFYRASAAQRTGDESAIRIGADFQDRIRRLDAERANESADPEIRTERLTALTSDLGSLETQAGSPRLELERVKGQLAQLEKQSSQASQQLNDAYGQLTTVQTRASELQRTVAFMREVFQVLSQEHEAELFAKTMVAWFSEHFGVERCSLMVLDDSREILRIRAQRGIKPELVSQVRVRVGQGIAGWVAHNRKPLFVRVKRDAGNLQHTNQDAYNSDSFICVPLVHNDRLVGVLNLSNKTAGEPFDELDLDRAVMAASVIAISLGGQETARHSHSWS
jgi:putative methionine-R-sulfoxide reductase with GAF domain